MSDKSVQAAEKIFESVRDQHYSKLIGIRSRSERLGLVVTWIRQGAVSSKELGDLIAQGVLSNG